MRLRAASSPRGSFSPAESRTPTTWLDIAPSISFWIPRPTTQARRRATRCGWDCLCSPVPVDRSRDGWAQACSRPSACLSSLRATARNTSGSRSRSHCSRTAWRKSAQDWRPTARAPLYSTRRCSPAVSKRSTAACTTAIVSGCCRSICCSSCQPYNVVHETRAGRAHIVTEASIHQIYYSEQTRGELDPGFLPLDNSANERPDWREYWPMRRFLLGADLDPQRYYGFFSPKFNRKTTLTAANVHDFIRQRDGSADVISFSPFFDQMAFPLNIMELAIVDHDCRETLARCATLVAPQFQIEQSVMSSRDSVYCNFFVAKP